MVRILRDVIFLGPPGVGKGAQAAILSGVSGLTPLSMGDALRKEASSGSELGGRIRRQIDGGRFADDDTVCEIVEARLRAAPASGFLLDGFPRSVEQARRFEAILRQAGRSVERAILIDASEGTILERLAGRQICPICARTFHERFAPSLRAGVCDGCDGSLARRPDDEPHVQQERLNRYRASTRPLVEFYRERGLLDEVDGSGSVGQVSLEIRRVFESDRGN